MSKISIDFMDRLAEELETQNWESRWQVTLIEPLERQPTEEEVAVDPGPRTNIVISRVSASADSADAAATAFLQQTQPLVPGLVIEKQPVEMTFSDNVAGSELTIRFPATPTVTLVQLHLFRHDDGVMTQIVITTDTFGPGELTGDRSTKMNSLRGRALRFVPGTRAANGAAGSDGAAGV